MNKKIKITHDLADLHEGQQIILTLTDQHLLKGDELNQDQQQLQNIQLREKGETEFKTYMRQNIHKLADVNRSHLESKLEGNTENVILPHYDERKYQKVGIDVNLDEEKNELIVTKGILERIKQEKEQKEQEALNLKQNVIASEYLQPEKKVIKARKIVDKQKMMKELMSFLENEEDLEKKDGKELKNSQIRKKQKQEIKDHQSYQKYDDKNFDKAVKKAEEKVRAVEQYELELALLKHKNKLKAPKLPQSTLIPQKQEDQIQTKAKMVEMQLDPIMAFHKGAKDSLQQISYSSNLSLKDTKSGSASVLNVPLPSQRFLNRQKQLEKEQDIPESFQQIPEQQLKAMKKEIQFMEQQQNVGMGLSGTLKFLREKGMLNTEQFVGRANDQRVNYNQPGDRVKIEYRDERGRLLTQKEAYRMISQRFHDQTSGKNKLQKRRKKQIMEERIRRRQNGGTTMMNILQSQTEEAHMFIRRE